MKIIFLQTNYSRFLEYFYSKNTSWTSWKYKKLISKLAEEWFGSANFYSKNLEKNGWKAKDVIINDWNSQNKWAKEKGLLVKREELPFTKYAPPILKNLVHAQKWITNILFEQIKLYKPDIVYSHNVSILSSRDLRKIKKQTRLLVGQIASPLPLIKGPLYEYDLLISSFPHFVKKFRNMGIPSEYLAWCVEKSIVKNIGEKSRNYNVVYVGGFTPHHRRGNKVLEELARNVKVDFWGYGDKSLLPSSSIRKSFHGQAWGKKMYEIYAKSKIVINRHIDISGSYANNMRMFEATAMGALLITEYKNNLNDFFKPGKEIVTYKNSRDLIKKINYYLKHNSERKRIAKAGQARTLKEHTYGVRMKTLDKILRNHLKKSN